MKIIVLQGSPRRDGNTSKAVEAFRKGATSAGHEVTIFDLAKLKVAPCIACEGCHKEMSRRCVMNDDMQTLYPVLDEAEMLILASPIYYHGFSGQLQSALTRIYALDKPLKLKRAALILSSADRAVYTGAIYAYERSFLDYLSLQNEGIFTYAEEDEKGLMDEKLEIIRTWASRLRDTKEDIT